MNRIRIIQALLAICCIFVIWMSFYKLTETPPTWMDEGVITQIARNMTLNHRYALQIAPDTFTSGGFITTAYPVLAPVSLSFTLFGVGILQARVVMALFIIAFFATVYFFFRRKFENGSEWFLVLTLGLLATFGPLYGQGKNVLGEVPGLFYLMLGLIFLQRMYENRARQFEYAFAGLFFGLAIVTKPIYILIAPALVFALIIFRKNLFQERKTVASLLIALLVPIAAWLFIQFHGENWHTVAQLYSNPNANANVVAAMLQNIKRFFTEAQPFYTLLLFLVWTVSAIWRYAKKKLIAPPELVAWTFSLLVLLAFTRTAGFYRYFFEAETLALIFFTFSIREAVPKFQKQIIALAVILILLQSYQLFFNSWVAVHNEGHRSAELAEHIGGIPSTQSVFFYQVPEAVNFISPNHNKYYQFIRITTALALGESSLDILKKGIPDIVVISNENTHDPQFAAYPKKEEFDRYVILRK